MSELFELDVSEAAATISSGVLSPTDLIDSLIERIETLDGAVHAWVLLDAENARETALLCAAEARKGKLRGPLHGVPFGCKDIYFTEGLATEAGSPLHRGFIPDKDAAMVARLRQAGAIVLGKTETTQFAMGDPAPTRNPWNLSHTPGGSSSGSAAAVAARMIPAALGTQTAGSVLRPAAFCGVAGFKPTASRFSSEGIFPLAWTLDHPGTLTRSVRDAGLLASVLDVLGRLSVTPGSFEPPRLALLRGRFLDRAEDGTLDHLEQVCHRFAKAGATITETRLPDDFELSVDVHHLIMAAEAAAYHAANHAQDPAAYRTNLRTLIETGSLVPATAYLDAQRLRVELAASVAVWFDGVDCLLMPSALGAAPAGLESTGSPVFNAPWSLLGLPALSLPSGLSRSGMPYGLQLIGDRLGDAVVLEAGSWCESVLGSLPMPVAVAAS